MTHQISIHSDGTPRGTVVVTSEGTRIEGIIEIDLHIESLERIEAHMVIAPVAMNVQVREVTCDFLCPNCGPIEHICQRKGYRSD